MSYTLDEMAIPLASETKVIALAPRLLVYRPNGEKTATLVEREVFVASHYSK